MPKRIRYEGKVHVFPDDFTDADIQQALSSTHTDASKTSAPQQPWSDQALSFGKDVAKGALAGAASTVFHGGDLIRRGLGMERIIDTPQVRSEITPPSSAGGKLGFGGEQAAEYFLPIGPEIKGAGLARAALRTGAEAARSGAIGLAQTGSPRGGGTAAALGAGGALVGEALGAVAPKLYERALNPAKKIRLGERTEMVERGLARGDELPIAKSSLPRLDEEVRVHKDQIEQFTKDPASPYSQRSIPIDDVLRPVDQYIRRLSRADHDLGASLARKRAQWAEELGYRPAVPARQVATGVLDARGNPIMRTIPGQPAQVLTTVAETQKLKEILGSVIPESAFGEGAGEASMTAGRKLARRGMRRAVETAIPEEAIKQINHVIEIDLRLKDAITTAVKKKPHWLGDAAPFILGEGAGAVLDQLDPAHPGSSAALRTAGAVASLARLASHTPGAMSRMAIALQRAGVAMPRLAPAAGAAGAAALASPPKVAAKPSTSAPERQASLAAPDLRQMINDVGERIGVPPSLLTAVMQAEHSGARAVSPKGAMGVMQLMPATAKQYEVRDPLDPKQSIEGAARLIRHLMEKYKGDTKKVLAAYNAGEGAVDRYDGVPPYQETQDYVKRGSAALTGR